MNQPVPEGFTPHTRKSPVTDPWEPLYARETPDALVLGLRAGPAHANGRGFVHGGLIGALADNAMGLSCARRFAEPASLLTVSLQVDFLGIAHQGAWLQFVTNFIKTGKTLCFAGCLVDADGAPVARASATFHTRAAAHTTPNSALR